MPHNLTPSPRKFTYPVLLTGAKVVHGAGRGRGLGVPTINIDLSAVPNELKHGIYACRITIGGITMKGAMHFGPRPVFKDSVSLEVHVLDSTIETESDTVDIAVVGRIRDVLDFPTTAELLSRIAADIEETRAMLSAA